MSNWEIKKLKYFLKVKHGKEQKLIEDKNGIYPILASGGEIGRTNIYLYDKPSVLIGRKGTIDKPQYIEQPFWTIDTLFYTKVNDNNNAKFFYYLFQTINWHKYNEGSTIPSLNSTTIESIVVKVPPLEEQEKIVSILSKQDEVIEKLEKLIDLKVRQKKGLMQRLLSGKLRLKGFSGEWKETTIGNCIYFLKKEKVKNPSKENLLLVKLHCLGIVKSDKIAKNTENGRPYYKRYKGEILIGRQNFHNGGFGIVKDDCDGFIASNAISSIDIQNEKVNKYFLLFYMQRDIFYKKIEIFMGGTGQKEISEKQIKNIKIHIPPTIEEQSAIASILSKCDEEIELLKKKLGLYRGQKKWLMEKLLSGEIRV